MREFLRYKFGLNAPYTSIAAVAAETGGPWAYVVDPGGGNIRTYSGFLINNANQDTIARAAASATPTAFGYGAQAKLRTGSGSDGTYRVVLVIIRADGAGGGYCAKLTNAGGGTATPTITRGYGGAAVATGTTFATTAGMTFDLRERDRSTTSVTLEMLVNGTVAASYTDNTPLPETGRVAIGFLGSGTQEFQIEEVSAYPYAVKLGFVVFDGNSLTWGQGATSGQGLVTGNSMPGQCITSLGAGWSGVNFGVPGQRIDQMTSDATTQIDPAYDATYVNNVLVMEGALNDFFQGASVDTVYARAATYGTGRKAANPDRVNVLCTVTASAEPYDPDIMSHAAELNKRYRRDYKSMGFDRLADLAARPELMDYANATYFSDGKTHWTDAGYGVAAGVVKSAILLPTPVYGAAGLVARGTPYGPNGDDFVGTRRTRAILLNGLES